MGVYAAVLTAQRRDENKRSRINYGNAADEVDDTTAAALSETGKQLMAEKKEKKHVGH